MSKLQSRYERRHLESCRPRRQVWEDNDGIDKDTVLEIDGLSNRYL